VPFPDSETTAGELVALLTKDTVPVALPLAWGVNVIVTFWLLPPAIVIGGAEPVRLNPVPVKFAAETVTEDVPVFESFTAWFVEFPTRTLPKVIVVGDALNRYVGAAVPVPDKLITGAVLLALLAIVIVPV
jgi:hypothetical protein